MATRELVVKTLTKTPNYRHFSPDVIAKLHDNETVIDYYGLVFHVVHASVDGYPFTTMLQVGNRVRFFTKVSFSVHSRWSSIHSNMRNILVRGRKGGAVVHCSLTTLLELVIKFI